MTNIFYTKTGEDIFNLIRDKNQPSFDAARSIMNTLIKIEKDTKTTNNEMIAAMCIILSVGIEDMSGGNSAKLCIDISNIIYSHCEYIRKEDYNLNEE